MSTFNFSPIDITMRGNIYFSFNIKLTRYNLFNVFLFSSTTCQEKAFHGILQNCLPHFWAIALSILFNSCFSFSFKNKRVRAFQPSVFTFYLIEIKINLYRVIASTTRCKYITNCQHRVARTEAGQKKKITDKIVRSSRRNSIFLSKKRTKV